MFDTQLLFFFSALGAFNGLILSLYFVFQKPRIPSNIFLGIMLLMMSIRVGKSVFFYFNQDLDFHFLQFGLTACFFIGPFLFFYASSLKDPTYTNQKEWKIILGISILVALFVSFIYPFKYHQELWRPYIIYSIYFQWFFFILASSYRLRGVILKIFSTKTDITSVDFWVISILFGNLVILTSYLLFHYTFYIVGALSFSFLLYLLLLLIIYRQKGQPTSLKKNEKYANKIEASEADRLLIELDQLMKNGIYKNQNLKLSLLAEKMETSTHKLSQLINGNLGKSFNQFVNEKRVDAATSMIKKNHQYTLEAIGHECGFKSKSTFYSAFYKKLGTTPAKYKEDQRQS